MEYLNTQYLLDKRPKGMPDDDCWRIHQEKITGLDINEILIEVKYLSIDPYMRGRMNDGISYASPAQLGEPMTGETAGVVVKSRSNLYKVGDKVCTHKGWQTYIKTKDTDLALIKVPDSNHPLSLHLGTLGMPGRTAYFGLNRVAKPKQGDTLVVSAASGAVGSVVGQLGKIYGCNVIGVAGGPEKCLYVKEVLKFDECIESNTIGTNAVFKFCLENKIKLIYSATSATLGNKGKDKDLSPYAFTKSKNLELLENLKKWFKFKFEVIFFYNVYGPGQITSGAMATVIGIFEKNYNKTN